MRCENDAQRNLRVRQSVVWSSGKEPRGTHGVRMGKASKWCCSMYKLQSRARLRVHNLR
jgi:hypothetical protein